MRKIKLLVALLLLNITAFGQMPQKLPLDPKVKRGQLDNGLTYYVMSNGEPKGLAEFYIVQKRLDLILEEENQRGLAHFLEHMAFNGTKHFPGNSLISYLESIGVKFGENLNAYTAIDETVYNISAVPISRESVIDSCLLILHDWSHELLLEEEEIDNERGVIREELRTRANAQMRMIESILPDIFPNNKYAHRMPGGLVEVVNNFKYQELRDYYHKWYRPDLQGIIVVGDFDADLVEQKIIDLFSQIPAAIDPAERTQYPIEPNVEPLVGIAIDPEAQGTALSVNYKKDPLPENLRPTNVALVYNLMNSLTSNMINTRLRDLAQEANPPFLGVSSYYGDFVVAATMHSFTINLMVADNGIERGLSRVSTEMERLKQHGFTYSELERAKANYLSNLERVYNEREKLDNDYHMRGLLSNFLSDAPHLGVEMLYEVMNQIVPSLSLEQINQYAASIPTEENLVFTVMMADKEGLEVPTKEDIISYYKMGKEVEIEPYVEELSDQPLISDLRAAGEIISESVEPITDAKVWNLSNGATVVVKESDLKEDEILFRASSRGGYSHFDQSDILGAKVINDLISIGGLGEFSNSNLNKVLAGKNVSIESKVNFASESVSGSSTPRDLESLMQLIYLSFTSIREDENAYSAWLSRAETNLRSMENNPMRAFSDSLQKTLYNNSPWVSAIKVDHLKEIDYSKVVELGRARFSNAADFVFTFVGNIDEAQLKEFVKLYIASLPADKGSKENWRVVDNYSLVKGKITKEFEKEMQTPKSTIYSVFSGEMAHTLENSLKASITSQVFDILYNRTIREEEQGTYGVMVRMNLSYFPNDHFVFNFAFDTDVTLKERLLNRAYKDIEDVLANGIDREDFDKVLTFMNKSYETDIRTNGYWLGVINQRYLLGKDYHTNYLTTLNSITPEMIDSFVKELFSTKNRVEVIMNGVEAR